MQGGGDRRNEKAMCDGGGYLMQTQEVGACGAVISGEAFGSCVV